jgi:hypothetical protein
MKEKGNEFLLELEKTILQYKPLRKYYKKEILYQDTLANWLRSQYPDSDVRVEVTRGSTRPDIIVDDIAIEIKGPTYDKDLQTISDKCMRYTQYYTGGMICVLFNVYVNQRRYDDWLQGMKNNYPDVIVIRK